MKFIILCCFIVYFAIIYSTHLFLFRILLMLILFSFTYTTFLNGNVGLFTPIVILLSAFNSIPINFITDKVKIC